MVEAAADSQADRDTDLAVDKRVFGQGKAVADNTLKEPEVHVEAARLSSLGVDVH